MNRVISKLLYADTLIRAVPGSTTGIIARTQTGLLSSGLIIISALIFSACSSGGSDGSTAANPADAPATPGGSIDPATPSSNPSTDDNTASGNTQAIELGPLPSPPLSPAPDADDEPIPLTGPTSTVTEYFLLRDPHGQLDDIYDGRLSEADFDAGPLPAEIQTPVSVNPAENAPPYFDQLDDVQVFAGDMVEIRLRPLDPDGNLPGMFPDAIPEGARYIDNFDGTRTLSWRPLQPDVGIREFTITAVDAEDPLYRTRRTIRIKIDLPSDPSTIINLPPAINLVRPHTVRVNDPVAIHIKGTDPNGTVPSLEVLNQPPGATLIPHFLDPQISILRFIPRTTGALQLQVVARDAVNPDSTAERTISINVRDEQDFTRSGATLRELASQRDLLIGYASLQDFYNRPDGAVYADIAGEEFNFMSTENSLKWDLVNPLPGIYRWASADNQIRYAQSRRMAVHGHTLIWHRQLPNWVMRSPQQERQGHMREYIDRLMTRYGADIPVWDVVNEALEEDGSFRNSTWFEAMGEDFIEIAFRQARLSAPNATLVYNDYDVAWDGPKSTALLNLVQSLKDKSVPIDGVGFQLHVFAKFDQFDEIERVFQKVADLDLDIYITELDVSMEADDTEDQQAQVYRRLLSVCLEQPRCKAFQTWGFTDMYSWRRQFTPLLLNTEYQVKPAYTALQQRLLEN